MQGHQILAKKNALTKKIPTYQPLNRKGNHAANWYYAWNLKIPLGFISSTASWKISQVDETGTSFILPVSLKGSFDFLTQKKAPQIIGPPAGSTQSSSLGVLARSMFRSKKLHREICVELLWRKNSSTNEHLQKQRYSSIATRNDPHWKMQTNIGRQLINC